MFEFFVYKKLLDRVLITTQVSAGYGEIFDGPCGGLGTIPLPKGWTKRELRASATRGDPCWEAIASRLVGPPT